MEMVPLPGGEMLLGPLITLPAGLELECCGLGFNDRTVKARWRGRIYFLFRQDLERQPGWRMRQTEGSFANTSSISEAWM